METPCLSFLTCKIEMVSLADMGGDKLGISTKRLKPHVGLGTPSPARLPWLGGPCRPGAEAEAGLRELGQGLGQSPSSGGSPRSIQTHSQQVREPAWLRLKGGLPTRSGGAGAAGLWSLFLSHNGQFPP